MSAGTKQETLTTFDRDYFRVCRMFKFKHYRADGKYLYSGVFIISYVDTLLMKVNIFIHKGNGVTDSCLHLTDISSDNFDVTWKVEPIEFEEDQ